jgi:serpin B
MIEAFGSADFSGMNGGGGIWIDNVYHKAFVKVDEEGTEATAATAVVVVKSSAGPPIFRANHPFIFFITHKETGSILFMGKVEDPR